MTNTQAAADLTGIAQLTDGKNLAGDVTRALLTDPDFALPERLAALVPDGHLPHAYIGMIRDCLKDVERKHKRFITWLALCDGYNKHGGPAPSLRKMPSKNVKHQMYADAARLHSLLKLDGDRPHDLAGIAALINKAHEILG